ncbi:hypothetical protein [Pseudomonas fluorescens]|nr:hypothetical protein [Pseudomonas fluorescens]
MQFLAEVKLFERNPSLAGYKADRLAFVRSLDQNVQLGMEKLRRIEKPDGLLPAAI